MAIQTFDAISRIHNRYPPNRKAYGPPHRWQGKLATPKIAISGILTLCEYFDLLKVDPAVVFCELLKFYSADTQEGYIRDYDNNRPVFTNAWITAFQ